MKLKLLAACVAIAAAAGCTNEPFVPIDRPVFRLTATITENNTCSVNTLGKSYSSVGQIRGDRPSQFIGTIRNESHHGFACWVGATANDGDLTVLFSGNNFGKPLQVGTYTPYHEALSNTPPMRAYVIFRTSEIGADELRSQETGVGTVIVESTPSGGRTIRIDVQAVRWSDAF